MKKIKFIPILFSICLLASALAPAARAVDGASGVEDISGILTTAVAVPELTAGAALLTDLDSGMVYLSHNADSKVYPASLTKIMTTLLAVEAIEHGDAALTDQVTASGNCLAGLDEDSSTADIVPGETMSLENYLYCAMVASANEACNVVAEHISGSIEAFVARMNERAQALGCTGTHFTNVHGMPDENHYTTASDLTRITTEALSHPLFAQICSTPTRTVPATNKSDARELQNTNGLINADSPMYKGYFYEYAKGVKTGHTNDAGYCLVSCAEKNGIRLLCVVLGCPATTRANGTTSYGNFSDTLKLYDWVFSNFSRRDIVGTSELVGEVPVALARDTESVTVRPQESISAVLPDDLDLSTFTREIVIYSERDGETLSAPVSAGDVLGEMTISKDGVTYGTVPLIATVDVELSHGAFLRAGLRAVFTNPIVIVALLLVLALAAGYGALVIRYNNRQKAKKRAAAQARRAAAVERDRQAQQDLVAEFQGRRAERKDTVSSGRRDGRG